MTELLSLSRAARLAGVSRGALQAQIRRGRIETFEGQVRVPDLLRLYPSVSLEHSGMLEEVERIKTQAVPRDIDQDHQLPSPDVLLSRLRALSDALSEQVNRANGLQRLIDDLREQLSQAIPDRDTRERLLGWMEAECAALAEAPETEARRRLFAKDNFLRLMAASVKVIPSGHEFFVEGSEPILDAAVRAGLRMSYGCTNGNCGSCKARVVSGEIWKLREHDYVLSAREQQMGYMLACCHTAVTDLVLEAAEADTTADLPHQEIRAQIRKISRQTDDLLQIQVQTPRTQTLRFMAGQSARLKLLTRMVPATPDDESMRFTVSPSATQPQSPPGLQAAPSPEGSDEGPATTLPIASCPCNGRNLYFYVRRGRDAFSDALFNSISDQARQQSLNRAPVLVSGPYGDFVLRESNPAPAVFIAFDDSIAPIKSLLEHAISIDTAASFHLYWSTTLPNAHGHGHPGRFRLLFHGKDGASKNSEGTTEGFYLEGWCRALKDALDNFFFTPLVDAHAEDLLALIQADLPEPGNACYYLAGTAEPLTAVRLALEANDVKDQQIITLESNDGVALQRASV